MPVSRGYAVRWRMPNLRVWLPTASGSRRTRIALSPPGRCGPHPRVTACRTRGVVSPLREAGSRRTVVFAHPAQLSVYDARALLGTVPRGPPVRLKELQRLVTERIHARTDRERVRDVHVETLDPPGQAPGGDLVAERLDRVALGEVGLVGALVPRGELGIGGEPLGHLLHDPGGLDRADHRVQLRAGQVVERRERRAVLQPRAGLHHRRVPARAPRGHGPQRPRRPSELHRDDLAVGVGDGLEPVLLRAVHALQVRAWAAPPRPRPRDPPGDASFPTKVTSRGALDASFPTKVTGRGQPPETWFQRFSYQEPSGTCCCPCCGTTTGALSSGSWTMYGVAPG